MVTRLWAGLYHTRVASAYAHQCTLVLCFILSAFPSDACACQASVSMLGATYGSTAKEHEHYCLAALLIGSHAGRARRWCGVATAACCTNSAYLFVAALARNCNSQWEAAGSFQGPYIVEYCIGHCHWLSIMSVHGCTLGQRVCCGAALCAARFVSNQDMSTISR